MNLPLVIKDEPAFKHRGIMLDTSRHFLKVSSIIRTIDAMLYNKMNVLHLHLTDGDSFPLFIDSVPELSQFGSFEEDMTYSKQDVLNIVEYGNDRGVRVIPELDTPSHTRAWGLSEKYKDIISCGDLSLPW